MKSLGGPQEKLFYKVTWTMVSTVAVLLVVLSWAMFAAVIPFEVFFDGLRDGLRNR